MSAPGTMSPRWRAYVRESVAAVALIRTKGWALLARGVQIVYGRLHILAHLAQSPSHRTRSLAC